MAIAFGTGGLRGIMGEGPNQMNARTVARASRGVARALLQADEGFARRGGVVIAHDTRHLSRQFARAAADVFAEAGLPVYLFPEPTPTPVLSFAVRQLGCAGGVVVTASHNPKEYNGYKVYNRDGCQLVPHEAEAVAAQMEGAPDDPAPAPPQGAARPVPDSIRKQFFDAVLLQSRLRDPIAKQSLSLVYTPLHGAGAGYVPHVLWRAGFEPSVVSAQWDADGDFPTVKSPNPEDRAALLPAIAQAKAEGAALVLGTDPDCDRVGAAVRHRGEYVLITGNQMGALLMDFIIKMTKPLPKNGAAIKTIVTSDLGARVARAAGLTVMETLTGFKYIGEKIGEFEKTGAHTFVFGYEESYGYLCGTHARDKDAVVSSLLIAEMAAWHQSEGRTLVDALDTLFARHGAVADALDSAEMADMARTDAILSKLRALGGAAIAPDAVLLDYFAGLDGLPPSDVLKYALPDGSFVAVRPSGTEPKMKVYYSAAGETQAAAREKLAALQTAFKIAMGE